MKTFGAIEDASTSLLSAGISDHRLETETLFAKRDEPTLWSCLSPVVSEVTIGSSRHPRRVYHRGDMRLVCPGRDIKRTTDEPATIRAITIPSKSFCETIGVEPARLESGLAPLQRFAFRSDLVETLVERLHQASKEPGQLGRLYADTLKGAAAVEMWRLSGNAIDDPVDATHALSAKDLREVDRFIDAHSAQKIDAAALAQLLDMPVAAFQSVFRKTTGRTLFQYVLSRRIGNAKSMIERSSLSLAEIAYRNGFSSQSHMTDVFRAKLGLTPGAIRRALA